LTDLHGFTNMTRTFHHKFTLGSKCGVILFISLAIYLFWIKSAITGCVFIALSVLVIERVLHSEYVFSDDTLTVYRGRFAKSKTIRLNQIRSCRPITTTFGLSHYLLLEYGEEQYVAVEPEQEASFIKYLQAARQSALSQEPTSKDDER
jgi:hypothetical protein